MPRIPLYNEGRGPAVQLATGPLSRRADVGAFTAPGQALASFGEQASQIAFQFGEAEKKAETERVYAEKLSEFGQQADDLITNPTAKTVRGFEIEAGEFRTRALADIDGLDGLTNSQRETIKINLGKSLDRKLTVGRARVYDRHIADRTNEANTAINYLMEEAASNPQMKDVVMREIRTIYDGGVANGLTFKMGLNDISAGIDKREFELDSLGAEQVNDPARLLNLRERIFSSDLSREDKTKLLKSNNEALSRVRTSLTDQLTGIIMKADGGKQDFESASEDLIAGKPATFMVNGQPVVIDPATIGLTNKNIASLAKVSTERGKNLEDIVSDSLLYDLNTSFDPSKSIAENATNVANLYTPSGMVQHGKDYQELDGVTVNYASQLVSGVANMITAEQITGNDIPEMLMRLDTAETILSAPYAGRTPLRGRVGAEGDNSRKELAKIAKARADLQKYAVNDAKLTTLTNVIANGDLEYVRDDVSDKDVTDATKNIMAIYSQDIPKQISILAANDITYPKFKNVLNARAVDIQNPNFVMDADGATEVTAAVQLYKQMKLFGNGVIRNHVDEKSRNVYEALITLEPHFGLDGAVKVIQQQRDEIDIEASYKTVEKAVESIKDEQSATYSWYEYIPGLGRDEEFSVQNSGEVVFAVSRMTKEYIKLGVEPETAVELAAKDYGATHKRIRNVMVPITKGLPDNIEEMATDAVNSAFVSFPELEGRYETDELSIAPLQGTNDRWTLIYAGGQPVILDDGKLVQFSLDDLNRFMEDKKADEALVQEAKRVEINKVNQIETDYRLGRGEFENLSPYEAQVLRLRKLKPHLSFTLDSEDIKRAIDMQAEGEGVTPEIDPAAIRGFQ